MPTMSFASSQASRFPTTDEIGVAMELAGSTIEGAEYLAFRIRELADKSNELNKNSGLKNNIIAAVDKYVEYVKFKLTANGQPWSGQEIEVSDLKNMQNNIAAAAVKELSGELADLKIDYAVSSEGHYVRGYSSDNGGVSVDTVSNLDKIFNAWLAAKDYVIKDGFIYNAQDMVQSEHTRVNADIIKQLIADGGLKEFMTAKGISNIEVRERPYPGEEKVVQAKQDAEAAVKDVQRYANEDEGPEANVGAGVSR